MHIIESVDTQPQVSRIAQQKHQRYPPEEIFRSQNRLIIEAVSKEFVFILEFFDLKTAQCSFIFNQIFQKVINYYLDWLSQYIQINLYDVLAILLMTIVNEENKKLLHKNKILVLDYFFDKVNMLLWPRFSQLYDGLIENVKKVNMTNFKLYNQTTVHASTIKYAETMRSLCMIAPYLSQDMLALKVGSFRTVFIEFLQ